MQIKNVTNIPGEFMLILLLLLPCLPLPPPRLPLSVISSSPPPLPSLLSFYPVSSLPSFPSTISTSPLPSLPLSSSYFALLRATQPLPPPSPILFPVPFLLLHSCPYLSSVSLSHLSTSPSLLFLPHYPALIRFVPVVSSPLLLPSSFLPSPFTFSRL